MISWVKLTEN